MITRRLVLAGSAALASPAPAAPTTSIDEAGFRTIGGLEQWVSIRGENSRNPVVLIVHGGPGEAQSALSGYYTSGWERNVTVVQWDQRGSGRTFGRKRDAEPTIERLTEDGAELSQQLAQRFGRPIVLVGHSWGAYLGARIAKQRPELFAAYVATGQLTSWRRLVHDELAFARARAKATSNAEAEAGLAALDADAIGVDEGYFRLRRWLTPYLNPTDLAWTGAMPANVAAAPGVTPQDVKDWGEGQLFSIARLGATVGRIDMANLGYRYETPYVLLHGREDHVTSAAAALDYAGRVTAPSKHVHLVARGGHYAMMTQPDEFLANLLRFVR